jgi:hypothetical protein
MYARGGLSTLLAPLYDEEAAHCLQLRRHMRSFNAGRFLVFIQPTASTNRSVALIPLDNMEILLDISDNQGDLWSVSFFVSTIVKVIVTADSLQLLTEYSQHLF